MKEKFLSDTEMEVIFFIERYHASMGETPLDEQIKARFEEIDDEFLQDFKVHPLVQKSMDIRGILYPAAADRFTAQQMHAVAAMTDYVDRRSDEKKLRDLGITTRQWSSWLQDENFAQYLRDRSERLLSNSMHEAHKGLVKGVRNGNVASIKTYYQITGRHDPDRESQLNVRQLLHSFIEVIQKHIKDPILLHSIATEMSNMASRESYTNALTNSMVNGQPLINRPALNGSVIESSGFDDGLVE